MTHPLVLLTVPAILYLSSGGWGGGLFYGVPLLEEIWFKDKNAIFIHRGVLAMLMPLLLIILSALDVLFFFLPSPIDPKLVRLVKFIMIVNISDFLIMCHCAFQSSKSSAPQPNLYAC